MTKRQFFIFILLLSLAAGIAQAQTTSFTYQGKLTDGGSPASGPYDLVFRLFDGGGTQIGSDLTKSSVMVSAGIFTVSVDFGASPFTGGTADSLEIAVRPGGSSGAYTTLAPRQPVTSSPYAIKSSNAASADTSTNSVQLGGVVASQYVITTDSRMTDARIPTPGSGDYIQNTTSQQSTSNFNVSGDGTVGGTLNGSIVNASTQYNIGTLRAFYVSGLTNNNTVVGVLAGSQNPSGGFNSFFGCGAGQSTSTGAGNAFFGCGAGGSNTAGNDNSFFGRNSGIVNTSSENSFFGSFSGSANTTGFQNAFFGKDSGRNNSTGFENAFFGWKAGLGNTTGQNNAFFGETAGFNNLTGNLNTIVGESAGVLNSSGNDNVFIGARAGETNTTGTGNTLIGRSADVSSANLTNATAIGYNAKVTQSNSLVLGSSANVGIGTGTPANKLQIIDGSNTGLRVQTNAAGGTVASFGGSGAFQIDSDGIAGGRFSVLENGNVGVGTASPAATLEVNGYTKLGSDAPSIRVKKLTGTTAASDCCGAVSILLGVDVSKILSVSVMVDALGWIGPNEDFPGGFNFYWVVENGAIFIQNSAGDSYNIFSKPIKILIIYEQ